MLLVGLTGGIGSGKTTVAKFFMELGIPVYFADDEAKKLMSTSKRIKNKLIKAFGSESFINDTLNRSYLASIVFSKPEKLKVINTIVHPEVIKHFEKWVLKQKAPYVIQENAIIFENEQASRFDKIITVTAPIEKKIERIITRDNTNQEAILLRMENQWNDKEKLKLSDFEICNTSLEQTKNQVIKIHKKLISIC